MRDAEGKGREERGAVNRRPVIGDQGRLPILTSRMKTGILGENLLLSRPAFWSGPEPS